MKKDLHTVTLPIADYNELLDADRNAKEKILGYRNDMEELGERSREFVSALAFLEDKGLLDEFNASINKAYKLGSVGINTDYKIIVK